MAWIERDRSGNYHVGFRLGARKFKRSLKTESQTTAERLAARLEENIVMVERGRLEIPAGADPAAFLLSDGKLSSKPQLQEKCSLSRLFDLYFGNLPEGSLEPRSSARAQSTPLHQKLLLGTWRSAACSLSDAE